MNDPGMIERQTYLSEVRPFMDKDIVKVLVGMRRSGKSVLLQQIQAELIQKGIPTENMLFMNFESMQWERAASSYKAFYDEVSVFASDLKGKAYLFFDEIQTVDHWEKAVNSFRVDFDCDIYITGSNSKLLSGELSTLITGRYVSFVVYPFSFDELREALPGKPDLELWEMYRVLGGMPFLSSIDYARESSVSYLQDVFNSILLKDIVQRNGFRNSDQLERVLTYFISEIGTTYSVDNMVNVMKSEKRPVSNDSVYNYLKSAEDAMLISRVKRYDVMGKAILRGSEKVYITDIGLREAVLGSNDRRPDLIMENIVFNELKRRGYDVFIGRNGEKEIDFIAQKGSEKAYIQVAYLMENESTRDREFSAFIGIEDNFPKYVISSDRVDYSKDGVQHLNIIEFLSGCEI